VGEVGRNVWRVGMGPILAGTSLSGIRCCESECWLISNVLRAKAVITVCAIRGEVLQAFRGLRRENGLDSRE